MYIYIYMCVCGCVCVYIYLHMYVYIIYNCIMSISNPQLNGIKETITRYYKIFSNQV